MTNKQYYSFFILFLYPFVFAYSAFDIVDISVTVPIQSSTCKLNTNDLLIEFNDIPTSEVNGLNHKRDIPFKFQDCEDKNITFSISSEKTDFGYEHYDEDAIVTNGVKGLGILITLNGKPILIKGSKHHVNSNNFELASVLVKKEGVRLPPGNFNAMMTVFFEYE